MASLGRGIPLFAYGWHRLQAYPPSNFVVDGATDTLAYIFQAPANAPILTKAAVRPGVLTGSPAAYTLSLQGVDADGKADGTIKHDDGGTNDVSVEMTLASGDAGTFKEFTFANHYHSTAGEWLALVITPPGTGVDGSNNWSFGSYAQTSYVAKTYSYENNGGSFTKRFNAAFGISDGSVWYGEDMTAAASYTSGTAVAGNKITIPDGIAASISCVGCFFFLSTIGAGSITYTLYDESDTELTAITVDTDYLSTATAIHSVLWDSAAVSLTPGSTYRIVAYNAASQRNNYGEVSSADHWGVFGFPGQIVATSGGVGSWTDVATRRYSCGLLISDITEPTGGGGGPVIGSRIVRGLGAL